MADERDDRWWVTGVDFTTRKRNTFGQKNSHAGVKPGVEMY